VILCSDLQDQKKIQDQLKAEQEALYGSKPSPSKPQSTKKAPRHSMGGANRRLSLGGPTTQAPKTDIMHSKTARAAKKAEDLGALSPSKLPFPFIYCNFFSIHLLVNFL
jgi:F-type H+-transporting ATPase subunit beta/protein regulator of cytokinesis 1